MKSVSADLLAASKSASRTPYIPVTIENKVGAVRRQDWTILDTTTWTMNTHDIAVSSNGTVHRLRTESGAVKYQRLTNPGAGPYNSWTDLETGMGTKCAISARGARVLVVYTNAAGTGIRWRESTDSGATFSAAALLTTAAAAVTDLACAYKSAANSDSFLAWGTAAALNGKARAGGTWGSDSASGLSFATVTGVAACYGGDYDLVVTGTETTTTKPTVWAIVFGDGLDESAGVWGAKEVIAQAESTAGTIFQAPFVIFADVFRANFFEAATYSGGVSRTWRTHLHPTLTFQNGDFAWRSPLMSDRAEVAGLALCATETASGVSSTSRRPTSSSGRRATLSRSTSPPICLRSTCTRKMPSALAPARLAAGSS